MTILCYDVLLFQLSISPSLGDGFRVTAFKRRSGIHSLTSFWPFWLGVLPHFEAERRTKMGKTDGIRALDGLLHDLNDEQLMVLVASENRSALLEFLDVKKKPMVTSMVNPQFSMAAARRSKYQHTLRSLPGFKKVKVPQLQVVNTEYQKTLERGMDYFYIPITTQADYDRFMTSVGQGTHWTVTDQNERLKIVWNFTPKGYWIKVEVTPACPRIKTSWNDLMKLIRLLSLVEYAVVWHLHKMLTNTMLDQSTWTWLRTRFGSGALFAFEYYGEVFLNGNSAECLSVAFAYNGGRASEVVN